MSLIGDLQIIISIFIKTFTATWFNNSLWGSLQNYWI